MHNSPTPPPPAIPSPTDDQQPPDSPQQDQAGNYGFPPFDDIEARVLGCLVEKQMSTPEYYPLTLNALVAACNQKNNRQPVVEIDDKTVVRALDRLREQKLVWMLHVAGGRVPKYEHRLNERLFLDRPQEMAVLAELLLRGPQTLGQLRTRCERMHPFGDLAEVEAVLDGLAGRGVPIVARLPQLPGHKEPRYMQLLAGPPPEPDPTATVAAEPIRAQVAAEQQRLADLEAKIAELTAEIAELKAAFDSFRRQFQ